MHLVRGEFWVYGDEHVRVCWQSLMGFGKGNLSRSEPCYALAASGRSDDAVLGKAVRQLVRAVRGGGSGGGGAESRENDGAAAAAAVVDASHAEHLHLAPYEAAYLLLDERVLRIAEHPDAVTEAQIWAVLLRLHAAEPHAWAVFLRQYAAYRAYRLAGWAPHSGCKYGADFVLYRFQRTRVRHAHAPYAVLVRREGTRVEGEWIALQNKLRLTKQVAKRLVVCEVGWDGAADAWRPWLDGVRVREVQVDRWTADNKRGKNANEGW